MIRDKSSEFYDWAANACNENKPLFLMSMMIHSYSKTWKMKALTKIIYNGTNVSDTNQDIYHSVLKYCSNMFIFALSFLVFFCFVACFKLKSLCCIFILRLVNFSVSNFFRSAVIKEMQQVDSIS